MNCWVCSRPIEGGDRLVVAKGLPARLQTHEGTTIHLRCHGEWEDVRPAAESPAQLKPTTRHRAARKQLFAEDLAMLRGITRRQALRWLQQLEETHGSEVVGRVDRGGRARRFTTEAALSSISPPTERELDQTIVAILERLEALEREVALHFAGAPQRPLDRHLPKVQPHGLS